MFEKCEKYTTVTQRRSDFFWLIPEGVHSYLVVRLLIQLDKSPSLLGPLLSSLHPQVGVVQVPLEIGNLKAILQQEVKINSLEGGCTLVIKDLRVSSTVAIRSW